MRLGRHAVRALISIASLLALTLGAGCGSEEATVSAFQLTGDPWVPNIAGSGAANHDSGVTVTQAVLATQTGELVGLAQGWGGREISVSIDMTQDLGEYGSLSLVAEGVGFPAALKGGAYAVLTSLNDGTNELVNLARAGATGDCAESGAYTCTAGGSCSVNATCGVSWPSAFSDRTHWEQHQIDLSFGGYASTNTFPTCNWSGGTAQANADPACAFNSTFFVSNKLRSGVTYTAKYVLMADSYASLSGHSAGLKVTVVKKAKAENTQMGAIDVNVIFVGNSVSQASRNAKGKINLDSLLTAVQDFYAGDTVKVKLGEIRTFEWLSGETYANIAMDDFGKMVSAAGSILPAETSGKAINIFLVQTVSDNSSLLGISGGINGPMVNGLNNSGVLVSTFGKLDQFNPNCAAAPCSATEKEFDFADLELTVAHEIGHYLGLNHPSEATGATHDLVKDTPLCTSTSAGRLSIASCLNIDTNVYAATNMMCSQTCTNYSSSAGRYCPAAVECQFNHMMYWSSKHFTEGTGLGDGNLFSEQSGLIMNFHPLVQ